jgi:hypothetical protein
MITAVTPTDVSIGASSPPMPLWQFWLRYDASRLFEEALARGNVPDNLDVLEEAARNTGFMPQKRYADWPIDFDQFADGDWTISGDVRWPRLTRASDGSSVQMSWEDFFLSVPGRQAILARTKAANAAYYARFMAEKPLRSTLSAPQQHFNTLMEVYETTPKRLRSGIVDKVIATQWVQSQDIPSLTEYPLQELRVKLMERRPLVFN